MFEFDLKNNRIMLFILLALVVSSLSGMGESRLQELILTLPGLLIAITFHEFAHAWAADKLGDDTPRYQGRLTLNPLKHLDPVGSVLLLFAHFGWGKPVQVNPKNFKGDMGKGEAFVSFAGPAMNFIIAFLMLVLFYTLNAIGVYANMSLYAAIVLQSIITYAVVINIALGVFNLIPLPPLDGSKIFMNFLPFNARQFFMRNEKYFYIAFMVLFITGWASYIIDPILSALLTGFDFIVGSIFGLFS